MHSLYLSYRETFLIACIDTSRISRIKLLVVLSLFVFLKSWLPLLVANINAAIKDFKS